jgi:ubiquinone/menaquinone biosynthesis C-methylase UbiE
MAKTEDLILEWLSIRLPFGGGKAHETIIRDSLNQDVRTVLDIGCGRGAFKVFKEYETTGIDVFQENIRRAEENGNYAHLIQGDVRQLSFDDKSFDAVTCIEVIEHLTKEEGQKLLREIERIAKKVIVITTPWGFDSLPKRKDNPYLDHQSGWYPYEFEKLGFKVYPDLSLRCRMGNNPLLLMSVYCLSVAARPITRRFPDKYSNGFMAVKELSN